MTRRYVHNVGADVPLLSYADATRTFDQTPATNDASFIVNARLSVAEIDLGSGATTLAVSLWSRNLLNEDHVYRRDPANRPTQRRRDFFIETRETSAVPALRTRIFRLEYVDMSVKDPYDEEWKTRARTRIRRSDGVLAIVSQDSLKSSGQKWEIQCAKDEGTPLRGIWAYGNDRTDVARVGTMVWTWQDIADWIDGL